MDMVKVDPKLFVMCRLCVENMGMYQITPLVQEQMKYCFDIDVTPFDGLPQLICDTCEGVLSEYHTKKRTFIGKQNALQARLQLRKEMDDTKKSPQHNCDSTSQQHDEDVQVRPSSRDNMRRAASIASGRRTMSASSESSSDSRTNVRAGPASYKKIYARKKTEKWEASYNKVFVCRLCERHCKTRGNMKLHFKKHKIIFNNNPDAFKRHCLIKLKKIDCKSNVTGNGKIVVFNKDKIIRDEGKMHYYVLYTLKEEFKNAEVESDTSDDFAPKMRVKRRRLLSRSSTETVILNDAKSRLSSDHEVDTKSVNNNIDVKENVQTVMECIDLDDSSDGSTHNNTPPTPTRNIKTTPEKKRPLPKLTDHKTISSIVSACQKKYQKKIEGSEEQQRQAATNKRILMNIGLKAIYQQGFQCTGLLRYLEHENLQIKWIPINPTLRTSSKESKHVSILPRIKGKEDFNQDDALWKKVTNHNFIIIKDEAKAIEIQRKKKMSTNKISPNTSPSSVAHVPSEPDHAQNDCAVLFSKTINDAEKKLLNASPVANPKQLPKKAVLSEIKASPAPAVIESVVPSPVVQDESVSKTHSISIDAVVDVNSKGDYLCMPIITSTTSLAPGNETSSKCASESKSNGEVSISDSSVNQPSTSQKPAATVIPRIKVKNVTELMSEQALIRQNANTITQPNLWLVPVENVLQNQIVNAPSANNNGPSNVPMVGLGRQMSTSQMITSSSNGSRDYIILDTIQMPNAKTSSPFKYLQNLLQMHNIILLDGTEKLNKDFVCLIKFKLQFSQQSIDQPVVLCLSLHCLGNKLFLGVKDPNHPGNIDLNKLSANWQWEILKIYTIRELVVNKLFQNAQKINHQVFGHVQSFINILQSIKSKPDAT